MTKQGNISKVLLFMVLGATLIVGSVYIGFIMGKNNTTSQQPVTIQPTYEPSQAVLPTNVLTPTITEEPPVVQGKVEGKICYPSSQVPEGYILVKNIETGKVEKTYFEGVPPKSQNYSLSINEGKYVFAYAGADGVAMGFFTPCALTMHVDNCSTPESHQLTEVEVIANKTVNNIDLCDYYYKPAEKPNF